MNKHLIRLVALLLVPCLIGDTVTAAALSPYPSRGVISSQPLPRFNSEALTLRYLSSPGLTAGRRVKMAFGTALIMFTAASAFGATNSEGAHTVLNYALVSGMFSFFGTLAAGGANYFFLRAKRIPRDFVGNQEDMAGTYLTLAISVLSFGASVVISIFDLYAIPVGLLGAALGYFTWKKFSPSPYLVPVVGPSNTRDNPKERDYVTDWSVEEENSSNVFEKVGLAIALLFERLDRLGLPQQMREVASIHAKPDLKDKVITLPSEQPVRRSILEAIRSLSGQYRMSTAALVGFALMLLAAAYAQAGPGTIAEQLFLSIALGAGFQYGAEFLNRYGNEFKIRKNPDYLIFIISRRYAILAGIVVALSAFATSLGSNHPWTLIPLVFSFLHFNKYHEWYVDKSISIFFAVRAVIAEFPKKVDSKFQEIWNWINGVRIVLKSNYLGLKGFITYMRLHGFEHLAARKPFNRILSNILLRINESNFEANGIALNQPREGGKLLSFHPFKLNADQATRLRVLFDSNTKGDYGVLFLKDPENQPVPSTILALAKRTGDQSFELYPFGKGRSYENLVSDLDALFSVQEFVFTPLTPKRNVVLDSDNISPLIIFLESENLLNLIINNSLDLTATTYVQYRDRFIAAILGAINFLCAPLLWIPEVISKFLSRPKVKTAASQPEQIRPSSWDQLISAIELAKKSRQKDYQIMNRIQFKNFNRFGRPLPGTPDQVIDLANSALDHPAAYTDYSLEEVPSTGHSIITIHEPSGDEHAIGPQEASSGRFFRFMANLGESYLRKWAKFEKGFLSLFHPLSHRPQAAKAVHSQGIPVAPSAEANFEELARQQQSSPFSHGLLDPVFMAREADWIGNEPGVGRFEMEIYESDPSHFLIIYVHKKDSLQDPVEFIVEREEASNRYSISVNIPGQQQKQEIGPHDYSDDQYREDLKSAWQMASSYFLNQEDPTAGLHGASAQLTIHKSYWIVLPKSVWKFLDQPKWQLESRMVPVSVMASRAPTGEDLIRALAANPICQEFKDYLVTPTDKIREGVGLGLGDILMNLEEPLPEQGDKYELLLGSELGSGREEPYAVVNNDLKRGKNEKQAVLVRQILKENGDKNVRGVMLYQRSDNNHLGIALIKGKGEHPAMMSDPRADDALLNKLLGQFPAIKETVPSLALRSVEGNGYKPLDYVLGIFCIPNGKGETRSKISEWAVVATDLNSEDPLTAFIADRIQNLMPPEVMPQAVVRPEADLSVRAELNRAWQMVLRTDLSIIFEWKVPPERQLTHRMLQMVIREAGDLDYLNSVQPWKKAEVFFLGLIPHFDNPVQLASRQEKTIKSVYREELLLLTRLLRNGHFRSKYSVKDLSRLIAAAA
jgi:hypothetical protein